MKNPALTEELTNRYPEYAPMYAKVTSHRVKAAELKRMNAVAKVALLAAALALAVVVSVTVRVRSELTEVGLTTAEIRARVFASDRLERERDVFYRLTRFLNGAQVGIGILPEVDAFLEFDGLEPGTEYLLTFLTAADPKTADEGGDPYEIVGRLRFTTLSTGGGKSGGGKTPSEQPVTPKPGTSKIPAPSPSPSPSPTVAPELTIVTETLDDGQEFLPYSLPIMIRYTGANTIDFSVSGALPAGLTLSVDGLLSGTPALGTAGVWPGITVTAQDRVTKQSAEKTYSLTIAEPPPIQITTASLPSTRQTFRYKCQIETDWEDTSTLEFSASGLPEGIAIDPASGLISGTTTEQTESRRYAVTVTVRDTVTQVRATRTYELLVGRMETLTDLSIASFTANDGVGFLRYTIAVNDAVVTSITVDGSAQPVPAGKTITGDYSSAVGDSGTITLRVNYTLGGESRTKSASVSYQMYSRLYGAWFASVMPIVQPDGSTRVSAEFLVRNENKSLQGRVTGVSVTGTKSGGIGGFTLAPDASRSFYVDMGTDTGGSGDLTVNYIWCEYTDTSGTYRFSDSYDTIWGFGG